MVVTKLKRRTPHSTSSPVSTLQTPNKVDVVIIGLESESLHCTEYFRFTNMGMGEDEVRGIASLTKTNANVSVQKNKVSLYKNTMEIYFYPISRWEMQCPDFQ